MGNPGNALNYTARFFRKGANACGLRNITLSVTDRCNSKCLMCDIWKKSPFDMPMGTIELILSDTMSKNLRSINLTGGEPFLRKDLPEIHRLINRTLPGRRLSISTNGLLIKEILSFLEKTGTKNLTLYVSIDGTGSHNLIRGLDKAFEKTTETIGEIRKTHPGLNIKTKFTITPWNFKEILDAYKLSKEMDTGFQIKMIENTKSYTNTIDYEKNKEAFSFTESQKREILRQLKSLRGFLTKDKKLTDAFFVRLMIQYLNRKDFRHKYCNCAFSSLFMMPNGDAYLCRHMNPIGNLNSSSLGELWNSKRAVHIRNTVKTGRCPPCISVYGFYN